MALRQLGSRVAFRSSLRAEYEEAYCHSSGLLHLLLEKNENENPVQQGQHVLPCSGPTPGAAHAQLRHRLRGGLLELGSLGTVDRMRLLADSSHYAQLTTVREMGFIRLLSVSSLMWGSWTQNPPAYTSLCTQPKWKIRS
jgi:hypothetical protein